LNRLQEQSPANSLSMEGWIYSDVFDMADITGLIRHDVNNNISNRTSVVHSNKKPALFETLIERLVRPRLFEYALFDSEHFEYITTLAGSNPNRLVCTRER
jgi:hypothetical protein